MHIMVVEDDATCRTIVEAALTRSGMRVTSAVTGAQAIAMLDDGLRPDLLLTDIQLPGSCDGWLIARIYRDECPNLPVIYLTGSQPETDQVNNSIYLRKPVRPDLLVEAIRALAHPSAATGRHALH
jgi:CheY-like chemotaxis protein